MARYQDHDPLGNLAAQGVAVWLDDLSRELLATGRLQALARAGADVDAAVFAGRVMSPGEARRPARSRVFTCRGPGVPGTSVRRGS